MSCPAKTLSTNELYEKLKTYINSKFDEQKNELLALIQPIETKCNEVENRIITLERKIRKNNIVIFGLETEKNTDLLNQVLNKLNALLNTDISHTHVNDIYRVGKKNTIILELISHLQKKRIFQEIKKLKGTGISIANDLCKEDRQNNQILYNNLKEARKNNLNAYIKHNKLYVNDEQYTAQQLENIPIKVSEDLERSVQHKSSSAPPTPTIKPHTESTLNIQDNLTETPGPSTKVNPAEPSNPTYENNIEHPKSATKNSRRNKKEGRADSESDSRTLRNKSKK